MTYRDELIQVAAVAIAAIQNEDEGCTCDKGGIELVLLEIEAERNRQDKLWGCCNHRRDIWMLILVEEVGEVAKACIEENDSALAAKEEGLAAARAACGVEASLDGGGPSLDGGGYFNSVKFS